MNTNNIAYVKGVKLRNTVIKQNIKQRSISKIAQYCYKILS